MLNAMKFFGTWKSRVSPKLYVTMGAVLLVVVACAFAGMRAPQLSDDQGSACSNLPSFAALKNALATATAARPTPPMPSVSTLLLVAMALDRPADWHCPLQTSIPPSNLAAAFMDYSIATPSIPASPMRNPLRATALLLTRRLDTKSVA